MSGNTPINGLNIPGPSNAAMQTIQIKTNLSATRDAIAASRIPKQKVLNIKIKENQFVPMTVTNRDRDSFKFSATHHLMQKININGNGAGS